MRGTLWVRRSVAFARRSRLCSNLGQAVDRPRVAAEDSGLVRRAERGDVLLELPDDADLSVDVREVGGPDELVGAEQLRHVGRRLLIGLDRDVALPLEVSGRLVLEGRESFADLVLAGEPVEPVGDPAAAGLEDD